MTTATTVATPDNNWRYTMPVWAGRDFEVYVAPLAGRVRFIQWRQAGPDVGVLLFQRLSDPSRLCASVLFRHRLQP